jgi:uncharacterized protein with von Willebrand factor type A (vWA) domain
MVGTAERLVLGLVERLRRGGLAVTTQSVIDCEFALAHVGATGRRVVLEVGLATLVKRADDVPRYLEIAREYLGIDAPTGATVEVREALALDDAGGDVEEGDTGRARRVVRYSAAERLRRADLASLSSEERREALALLVALKPAVPERWSARRGPAPRGELDGRATLRRCLETDLEPVERRYQARRRLPRRLVFLVDVSGSMAPYAVAMLRLAWAFGATNPVETWAVGTRATRITTALVGRDPERAVIEAVRLVEDWGGGTRLGEGIASFVHRTRAGVRSAVIVICSDGWDRGDPARMAQAMAQLARRSARVVWVNPLAGLEGYAPLARGMAAALPHVDALVAGESVAALEAAARRIAKEATDA